MKRLRRWYASVMLNRLMFIYFIQKKGFLDGDPNYLRTRSQPAQQRPDHTTAASWSAILRGLCLAPKSARRHESPSGPVPYLNGGLFLAPPDRAGPGQTSDPDEAFERSSPSSTAITGTSTTARCAPTTRSTPTCWATSSRSTSTRSRWGPTTPRRTSQNTSARTRSSPICWMPRGVIAASHSRASIPSGGCWLPDPDRDRIRVVRHGAGLPLPPEIAARVDDVSKREGWNRSAPNEYALPTEIWREVVARRQRYAGGQIQPPISNL